MRLVFDEGVDCGQIVKVYGANEERTGTKMRMCLGMKKRAVIGTPDPERTSTSLIERQNLTMRRSIGRMVVT